MHSNILNDIQDIPFEKTLGQMMQIFGLYNHGKNEKNQQRHFGEKNPKHHLSHLIPLNQGLRVFQNQAKLLSAFVQMIGQILAAVQKLYLWMTDPQTD